MTVVLVRNDTFDETNTIWNYQDDAGVDIDITGYSVKLVIRTVQNKVLATFLDTDAAGARLVIPVGTDGEIFPDVAATNTNLAIGVHEYDLEITSAAGDVTTLINKGSFTINEDLG